MKPSETGYLLIVVLFKLHLISGNMPHFLDDLRYRSYLYTIADYPESALYLEGFPHGEVGTQAFPLFLKNYGNNDNSDTFFEQEFKIYNKDENIRKSCKKFQEKTREYMCGIGSSEWACCKYDMTNRDCSTVPDQAKEVYDLFERNINHLHVMFLFEWCIRAWADIISIKERTMSEYNSSYNATVYIKQWREGLTNEDKYKQRNVTTIENVVHAKLGDVEDSAKYFCPDPCLSNPCRSVKGVDLSAGCTPYGPFEKQYTCECQDSYQWDNSKKNCVPENPCYRKHFPVCVVNNMLYCVPTSGTTADCTCKDMYMGADCSLLKNACIKPSSGRLSGDHNCAVHLGNVCLPELGTDAYQCSCKNGYSPSPNMPDDNCLRRIDPCKTSTTSVLGMKVDTYTLTCLNDGVCVSSGDHTRVSCLCPKRPDGSPIFEGINCETPVGKWSGWSEYSRCLPQECGETRYRWRRRVCDDEPTHYKSIFEGVTQYATIIRCHGTSEEILPCPPLESCYKIELPSKQKNRHYLLGKFFAMTGIALLVCFVLYILSVVCIVPAIISCIERLQESSEYQ